MLVIFLVFLTCADAVYFSMTDINVTIPIDKGKLPLFDYPLATFYAGDSQYNYSIYEKNDFLKISQTGDVTFSKKISEAKLLNFETISAKITIQDTFSNETGLLNLDFQTLEQLDCDFFVEDLCFWKSVHYQIAENTKPSIIGSLASSFLRKLCSSCTISYTLVSKNDEFKIVSSNASHIIESTKMLDRENKSHHYLNILCTVENSKHTIRNVTRTLLINILDVDDNPPQAQENRVKIDIKAQHVHKNQTITHGSLIFNDKDSYNVNKYKATILNDTLKILKAKCTKFYDDHLQQESQTAVHCKLKFTKTVPIERWTYTVILQLNDIAMLTGNSVATVPIDLHFRNETGFHPELYKKQMKSPELYPSNKVKIFRTAAPLARLTQPLKNTNRARNFTLRPIIASDRDIFSITETGGIVFVHDARNLRNAPENVRLNISWIDENNKENFDEIEVHIMTEQTKTCEDVVDIKDWMFCSEFATPEECLSSKACALSTGGWPSVKKRQKPERCMWRGEINPSNESTTFYSTCTPDVETCPDEICDPLEKLHRTICPQDCMDNVIFPSQKNNATGLGIYRGTGVCTCSEIQCQCNTMKFSSFKPKKRKPKLDSFLTPNETILANSSKHIQNATSRILGIELARCGTTCVFGIVAGVLLLGGTAALIVICWKLDSVHKAVRNKFSGDSQDLSAPLSVYIDRSAPDPLPLNFDMTTSLADTAILNIINKYTPDPKWEFPRNQLIIEQTLGEGEFGKVLRAKAFNITGQTGHTTVAVKTLKDDARESELNDLLSEYQLLKEVSHPNVIRLLGVCTAPGGPIYLIIEFAEFGSLRSYLRRSRHLKSECGRLPSSTVDEPEIHYDEPNISKVTPKEILSFAWQICKGMAYLSEIKLVHRDLAARNVLLAADKICKISDFGLTRDIYEDDAYFKKSKGRVPVKWMAPESLSDHVYTNKSDVWSFGILVWELVTLGATPYPGIAVQNLFHLLRQGYRMERPDNCSPTLHNIMKSCWHIDPEQRPTFQELSALFEKMLSEQVDYLDLANNAIHNRSYFCSPFEDSSEASEKSESNPLNYLAKSQSYIKCGSRDKLEESSNLLAAPDSNQNINAPGYESPVKILKKMQTPTNDCPQYYTDMASGKKREKDCKESF